jgi:transcriptional regulator with XRE-family HTH domain
MAKVGEDLSKARRRRRITQASLAECLGCSRSTVQRIERGDGQLPFHFVARALDFFDQIGALEDLLKPAADDNGQFPRDQELPARVRQKSDRRQSAN